MSVHEFKAKPNRSECAAIDIAIRTTQFIRNKCICLGTDEEKVGRLKMRRYCAVLVVEFPFAGKLNSMACQAATRANLLEYVVLSNQEVLRL